MRLFNFNFFSKIENENTTKPFQDTTSREDRLEWFKTTRPWHKVNSHLLEVLLDSFKDDELLELFVVISMKLNFVKGYETLGKQLFDEIEKIDKDYKPDEKTKERVFEALFSKSLENLHWICSYCHNRVESLGKMTEGKAKGFVKDKFIEMYSMVDPFADSLKHLKHDSSSLYFTLTLLYVITNPDKAYEYAKITQHYMDLESPPNLDDPMEAKFGKDPFLEQLHEKMTKEFYEKQEMQRNILDEFITNYEAVRSRG